MLYAALLLVLFGAFYTLNGMDRAGFTYSQVVQAFQQEEVDSFVIKGNTLTMAMKDSSVKTYKLESFDVFYQDLNDLVQDQWARGILTSYDYASGSDWAAAFMTNVVPMLIMAVVLFFLFYTMMARQGGGGAGPSQFGKARTVEGSGSPKTFADVAGAEEEKAELQEIVDFLKNPQKFTDLGAHVPKGVLLVGPPGTGKTLIAKAVAGEAGVQFLSISGSDFVELYVGVGASRVRDLFEQGKKNAPSIIFIDEIDAVGRQRGTGLGGGHDEREQTLNQLLVEMDGFSGNSGVIVMAATNRKDILDPALLRPGRFDRQIYVGLPDIKGREAVLKVHARKKPLGEDVDLAKVAKATGGFTGADLENLMNEAALLAARADRKFLTQADLEEAIIKVIAGPEKRSHVVTDHTRRLTAYHEAGHAIVMHALPTHDPVHQISIIPRGQAGGMTISLPQEDKSFLSKRELFENIVALLGGRGAEELMLEDVSTGASNDMQRATAIARRMVTRYGMSAKFGTIVFDSGSDEVFIGRDMGHTKAYSEEIASEIDHEIKAILDSAYDRCRDILKADREKLVQVAEYLLEHETMSGAEFEKVFTPETAGE